MIAALLLPVFLLADAPLGDAGPREALIAEALEALLDGRSLPADTDEQLRALSPADRLEVLVFLRRSGLLIGPTWPVERLLAPGSSEGSGE
ncbi:hypothetical protein [Paracoccus aminophilus]|uniref:Uncharacterized protein n=1 Tax=Paracoccus aminophilus JCM 7686 TaxID=1367847 RepID=S5YQ97_PARAH|nr:hypothetical protein [Paracoccus aminophilus]AGT07451.1 hypothetical protein JCM7686_0342 [Paracoccus aminophilus JCM 7686]